MTSAGVKYEAFHVTTGCGIELVVVADTLYSTKRYLRVKSAMGITHLEFIKFSGISDPSRLHFDEA